MSLHGELLESLEFNEPSWLNSLENVRPASPKEAADFLNNLDAEEVGLFVLAHGLGMRIGEISQSLKIDPALVIWRMRKALARAQKERPLVAAAALELAITNLIRDPSGSPDVPPPKHGAANWSAQELVKNLDLAIQNRLTARLQRTAPEFMNAGIGIGVVVLVLALIAGFIIFGVIRDVNPLWRGQNLMREGKFAEARQAFADHWDGVAAQEQIALCYLAVGNFDAALEAMSDPGVRERLGAFAPFEEDVPPLNFETTGRALLPRGLTLNTRPTFVHRAGPPGRLHIQLGWRQEQLDRILELPDTRSGPAFARTAYPRDWPPLPAGPVIWATVPWVTEPDGTQHAGSLSQADFLCLGEESLMKYRSSTRRFLDRSVPAKARDFFRGHYLMREGLFTDAGAQFARLSRLFPKSGYPLEMIEKIAAILGVEPGAFLR